MFEAAVLIATLFLKFTIDCPVLLLLCVIHLRCYLKHAMYYLFISIGECMKEKVPEKIMCEKRKKDKKKEDFCGKKIQAAGGRNF